MMTDMLFLFSTLSHGDELALIASLVPQGTLQSLVMPGLFPLPSISAAAIQLLVW